MWPEPAAIKMRIAAARVFSNLSFNSTTKTLCEFFLAYAGYLTKFDNIFVNNTLSQRSCADIPDKIVQASLGNRPVSFDEFTKTRRALRYLKNQKSSFVHLQRTTKMSINGRYFRYIGIS